jgi:hypothetical protein
VRERGVRERDPKEKRAGNVRTDPLPEREDGLADDCEEEG